MNTRYRKSSLNKAAVGTSSSKEPTSRDSSASSKTPKADYKSTAPSTSIDIFTDDEVESSVSGKSVSPKVVEYDDTTLSPFGDCCSVIHDTLLHCEVLKATCW